MMRALEPDLKSAERAVRSMDRNASDAALFQQRMAFTRLSFEIIRNYLAMTELAGRDIDFAAARRAGAKALAARLELAKMNPTFTTRVIGPAAEREGGGPAQFLGEVEQLDQFQALTDGRKGVLVKKLPLDWPFRIVKPLPHDWSHLDLLEPAPPRIPLGDAAAWRAVRSDLYLQAQGIRAADGGEELGYYAYRLELPLGSSEVAGPIHLMFPGLFNQAWLYVNGRPVAQRKFDEPWWRNGYAFQWDVDLTGKLTVGRNAIQLIGFNPHHFAGMFRRPFLYRPR